MPDPQPAHKQILFGSAWIVVAILGTLWQGGTAPAMLSLGAVAVITCWLCLFALTLLVRPFIKQPAPSKTTLPGPMLLLGVALAIGFAGFWLNNQRESFPGNVYVFYLVWMIGGSAGIWAGLSSLLTGSD